MLSERVIDALMEELLECEQDVDLEGARRILNLCEEESNDFQESLYELQHQAESTIEVIKHIIKVCGVDKLIHPDQIEPPKLR